MKKRESIGGRGKGKGEGEKKGIADVIGEHLQTVAVAISSHTSVVVVRMQADPTSINKENVILSSIPEIVNDEKFYLECIRVLEDKEKQMWFNILLIVQVCNTYFHFNVLITVYNLRKYGIFLYTYKYSSYSCQCLCISLANYHNSHKQNRPAHLQNITIHIRSIYIACIKGRNIKHYHYKL